MKLLVLVRHGVLSNAENMQPLTTGIVGAIQTKSKEVQVDSRNDSYQWTKHIIGTAANLAKELCIPTDAADGEKESLGTAAYKADRIVLVGHSQGALLWRLVAAHLCDPAGCEKGFAADYFRLRSEREVYNGTLSYFGGHDQERTAIAQKLIGVVMVASPNGGAFTFGQLSLTGRLFSSLGRRAVARGLGHENWSDLATDRVFRFLQHANVSRLRYLSVSASGVNRFGSLNQNDTSLIPMVERLGIHFELPNDMLVEESSVDLREGTWKSEISNLAAQYEHVRWYDLSATYFHTTLHQSPDVHNLIAERIVEWLRPAQHEKGRPPVNIAKPANRAAPGTAGSGGG